MRGGAQAEVHGATARQKGKKDARGEWRGREAGISEEELAIFGLTDAESKIVLGLLELGPTSISKLSRETSLSHTTVHSAIRRLREQGLVRRVSRGYASVWEVASSEVIRRRFNAAIMPFGGEVTRENPSSIDEGKKRELSVFEGTEALLRVFQWFFLNNRKQHIRIIQTEQSLKQMHKRLGTRALTDLNEMMRLSDVKKETAYSEGAIKHLGKIMPKNKDILANSQEDNIRTCVVPTQFLEPGADICVLLSTSATLMVYWGREKLILFRDGETSSLFNGLFKLYRSAGESS